MPVKHISIFLQDPNPKNHYKASIPLAFFQLMEYSLIYEGMTAGPQLRPIIIQK